MDTSLAQEDLLMRAKHEVEQLGQQAILDAEAEADEERRREEGKKTLKKGKKILSRANHKGNYSSFRNKSFVPNASRVGRSKGTGQGEDGDSDDSNDSNDNGRMDGGAGDDDDDEAEAVPLPVKKGKNKGGKGSKMAAFAAVAGDSDSDA